MIEFTEILDSHIVGFLDLSDTEKEVKVVQCDVTLVGGGTTKVWKYEAEGIRKVYVKGRQIPVNVFFTKMPPRASGVAGGGAE